MTGTGANDVLITETPSAGVDHRALWKVLERFAGTLVDRYRLDEVLDMLGEHIRVVLGVAGAGVMLGDDAGNLRFTSTSGDTLHELERLQIEVGGTFADVATCYLMNARDIEQKDLLTSQLQQALRNRVIIEQAKGDLSAVLKIQPEDAFELIRAYARRHQIKARIVGRAVVAGDLDARELLAHS